MIEHYCVDEIRGPILIIKGNYKPMLGEIVALNVKNKKVYGQVLETSKDIILLQSFKKLEGVSKSEISVEFTGELLKFRVSDELVGRVLNGVGKPIDEGPLIYGKEVEIEGKIIRPSKRSIPKGMIQTGVSSIDLLNSLIRGQKLPIFTGAGLSHLKLIGDILKNTSQEDLIIIFAGIGLAYDEYNYIKSLLEKTGILKKSIIFLNRAIDPVVERLIIPRIALTTGEYFAFEKQKNVLCILYDITNYADGLREISSMRGEYPGRMGYPPYLYTDLATLFERSGIINGKKGSLTQIPILSMPNDDITHPIPDLTGYITEGQIILSRTLEKEGIFPAIDIIPSLSRLMHQGTKDLVREDFKFLGNILYTSYSKYLKAKKLKLISGVESLNKSDKQYLEFGEKFEKEFLNQEKKREFQETLDKACDLVQYLPDFERAKIPEGFYKYVKWDTSSDQAKQN